MSAPMDATDVATQSTILRIAAEKLAKNGGDGLTMDQRIKKIFRETKDKPENMPAAEAEEFKAASEEKTQKAEEYQAEADTIKAEQEAAAAEAAGGEDESQEGGEEALAPAARR